MVSRFVHYKIGVIIPQCSNVQIYSQFWPIYFVLAFFCFEYVKLAFYVHAYKDGALLTKNIIITDIDLSFVRKFFIYMSKIWISVISRVHPASRLVWQKL